MKIENNKEDINISNSNITLTDKEFESNFGLRISKIVDEFRDGFKFISGISKKSDTIFGGTRFSSDDAEYIKALKLGELLSSSGYTVVTGGGPGIMEAANKGAYKSEGDSVGINIELPENQESNQFVNKSIGFHYFFTRKMMMSFCSSVYVFFPGGYGTLDEFFEMVVLLQTKKLSHKVTIVVIGKDFWSPLLSWFKEELCNNRGSINEEELSLFKLVDTPEEALVYILEKDINKNN
jgi:uncharacterized protein (TIGR00730 family)